MSYGYKRTVYCSYCCDKGHNKRTCPELKQRAEEGSQWAKAEVARYKNTVRRCSFCSQTGHNRASCQTRKDWFAKMLDQTQRFRERLKEKLKEGGWGVGALIETYAGKGIITSFSWNEISLFQTDRAVISWLGFDGRQRNTPIRGIPGYYHENKWRKVLILSPASSVDPPASWTRGKIVDEFLEEQFREREFSAYSATYMRDCAETKLKEIANLDNSST